MEMEMEEMEEDSFVKLALRLGRNESTKGQGCQCLYPDMLVARFTLILLLVFVVITS